jgi:hypothetical protein
MSFIAHDPSTEELRFIHPSVQRWIDREPQRQKLLQHNYLAKTCLTYLNLFAAPVDSIDEHLRSFPFYKYAAYFWGEHAKETEHETDVQQQGVLAFVEAEDRRMMMFQTSPYSGGLLH